MSSAAVASRRHHQLPRAPRRARPPPPSPTAVWPVSLHSVPVGLFLRAVTAAAARAIPPSRARCRELEVAPSSPQARGRPPSCRTAVVGSSRLPAVLPRRRRRELGPPADLPRRRRRELEAARRLAAPPPPSPDLAAGGQILHREAGSASGATGSARRPLRPPPSAVRASRRLPRQGMLRRRYVFPAAAFPAGRTVPAAGSGGGEVAGGVGRGGAGG